VSWTTVSAATTYAVEEQVNGGGFTQIQNSASTSVAVSGKGNGTYGYRVRACNGAGCGPYSGTVSVTVILPPPTPTGLSVTWHPLGPPDDPVYRFTATWSASTGATSYEFSVGYTGPNTTYSWTVGELDTDQTFSVRACNANGCSAWSPAVHAFYQ
jgi:hypothetical protein